MRGSFSAGGGRSSRDVFHTVYRFVQRCFGLCTIIFIIALAYIAYVKTGYDRDVRSIANVTAGGSSVEQSSMHIVAVALQPEKVRLYVATPITVGDVENLHQFAAEYQRIHEIVMRGFNRIGWPEDEGEVSKSRILLMLANYVVTALFSYNKSPVFDKAVIELGGYEKHYGGVFGFAGVLAAIDAVALSHTAVDKNSDEMIEHVLEEQMHVKAQYDDGVIETDDGEMDVRSVIMASGPGIIALAKTPRASFEVWRALSELERIRIAEEMAIFKEGELFIGVAFDPAKVFRKVFVDEFNLQK